MGKIILIITITVIFIAIITVAIINTHPTVTEIPQVYQK